MARQMKTLTDGARLLQLSEILTTNIQTVISEWAKEYQPHASNDGAPPASLPSRKLYEAQRTLLALTGTLTELIAEPSLRILEVGCQYWESRALYIAAERRIPDLLAAEGATPDGVHVDKIGTGTGIESMKLCKWDEGHWTREEKQIDVGTFVSSNSKPGFYVVYARITYFWNLPRTTSRTMSSQPLS